jgi:hypothetical protein
MRVDALSDRAPAPTIRCSTRAKGQTRDSFVSPPYDLARLGTWQKLAVTFTAPDYTDEVYLAANTHSREEIEVTLYLDDWSLVPTDAPTRDAYAYLVADADQATLADGAALGRDAQPPTWPYAAGPGTATFPVDVPQDGRYALYLRLAGTGEVRVIVAGQEVGAVRGAGEDWAWQRVPGTVDLKAGPQEVRVEWAEGVQVNRLVVTDELPSAAEG